MIDCFVASLLAMTKKAILGVAVLAAVLASGCGKLGAGKPRGAIARVGKLYVTQADFDRKLGDVPPQYRGLISTPSGKKQFLDILVREKLMLASALESPVSRRAAYLDEAAKMKKEFDARFEDYKEAMLLKLWLQSLRSDGALSVPREEVRSYYEKFPYEISVSHILLADAEEAENALRLVKKAGNFAALAKAKSLDPETARDGGKIAPFIVGEFVPELENAACAMKTGEIQGYIKSKSGYHILKKNGDRKLSFEEAKDRIARILEKKKMDAYLAEAQSKFKVEVLDEDYKEN